MEMYAFAGILRSLITIQPPINTPSRSQEALSLLLLDRVYKCELY